MSGHLAQRRDHVSLARLPVARRAIRPSGPSTRRSACGAHQAGGQVQVGFRVYLHVRYPGGHSCHLGQDLPGGAARSAECGRELDERGARAERLAKVSPADVRRSAGQRGTALACQGLPGASGSLASWPGAARPGGGLLSAGNGPGRGPRSGAGRNRPEPPCACGSRARRRSQGRAPPRTRSALPSRRIERRHVSGHSLSHVAGTVTSTRPPEVISKLLSCEAGSDTEAG